MTVQDAAIAVLVFSGLSVFMWAIIVAYALGGGYLDDVLGLFGLTITVISTLAAIGFAVGLSITVLIGINA